MRLWIFLIYLYEHVWKECKCVTGLEWWWWWCTELPPSVMDLFQRKLKLALFHSCICWQSAFLPFLSASMLWCSLSNISLFLWRLLINVALTVDVWLWMLFDSVVPSCLSMCSHGDTQQHNGTPDLSTIYYNWKKYSTIRNYNSKIYIQPFYCSCLKQLVKDTLQLIDLTCVWVLGLFAVCLLALCCLCSQKH